MNDQWYKIRACCMICIYAGELADDGTILCDNLCNEDKDGSQPYMDIDEVCEHFEIMLFNNEEIVEEIE